jgi:hypothetical protein
VNVDSERFHEGRGAGKKTTPGGREKNAYFLCDKYLGKVPGRGFDLLLRAKGAKAGYSKGVEATGPNGTPENSVLHRIPIPSPKDLHEGRSRS